MRNRLRIWPGALLAAVVPLTMCYSVAAQSGGRATVVGRHEVRAALATAMADGTLSRMEAYSVLLRAKELLPADEIPGVKRTLDRLSSRGEASLLQASYDQSSTPIPEESPFKEESLLNSGELLNDDTLVFGEGCESCDQQCDSCYEGFGTCGYCCPYSLGYLSHLSLLTSVDAFKGPADLGDQSGNFGFRFAINGTAPLTWWLGTSIQAGTSAVLTDFQGTPYSGDSIRSQSFTTVGLYQRVAAGSGCLRCGFAFDWLLDDYYAALTLGQWRVKLAYELNPFHEIGIWSCIPNDGDSVLLDCQERYYRLKPVAQGNFYHRRCWANGNSLTTWLGIVEEPGELVLGTEGRIPIGARLAFVGNFQYILPSASGQPGQDEEMWNVSMGIEYTPGCKPNHCLANRNGPLFRLADNGTFAIRRY